MTLRSCWRGRRRRGSAGRQMPKADILGKRTVNYLELIGHDKSYRALPYQGDYS